MRHEPALLLWFAQSAGASRPPIFAFSHLFNAFRGADTPAA
jgi:hypothetical protein